MTALCWQSPETAAAGAAAAEAVTQTLRVPCYHAQRGAQPGPRAAVSPVRGWVTREPRARGQRRRRARPCPGSRGSAALRPWTARDRGKHGRGTAASRLRQRPGTQPGPRGGQPRSTIRVAAVEPSRVADPAVPVYRQRALAGSGGAAPVRPGSAPRQRRRSNCPKARECQLC